jgi:ABC-type antimicrobial peptide transport system permease subunit
LALGAKGRQLVVLMMWHGLRPVFAGLALGLLASVGCGWLIRSLLFGVPALHPVSFAIVALLLTATASLACLLPASAVARMAPAIALRYE